MFWIDPVPGMAAVALKLPPAVLMAAPILMVLPFIVWIWRARAHNERALLELGQQLAEALPVQTAKVRVATEDDSEVEDGGDTEDEAEDEPASERPGDRRARGLS